MTTTQLRPQILRAPLFTVNFGQASTPMYLEQKVPFSTAGPQFLVKTVNMQGSTLTSQTGFDGRFRPCTHSHYFVGLGATGGYDITGSSPRSVKLKGFYDAAQFALIQNIATAASVRPATVSDAHVQWNARGSDAMNSMLPTLTTGNSLMNFIYELKDFKRIGAHMGSLFALCWARLKAGRFRSANDKAELTWEFVHTLFGSKPWNNPGTKLTSAWLSWQLAWRPLVNDLKSLLPAILDFNQAVKEFVRREGLNEQRYWGVNIPTVFSPTTLSEGNYFHNGANSVGLNVSGNYTLKETVTTVPRFVSTMRYSYALPSEVLEAAEGLDGLLDMLGVNANPAILWNAIPFSFVIDWFVNVGGFLNKLRVNNVRPNVEIRDFCSSVKVHRDLSLTMDASVNPNWASTAIPAAGPRLELAYARSTYYKRITAMPAVSLTLGSGINPTNTRIYTALSLGYGLNGKRGPRS